MDQPKRSFAAACAVLWMAVALMVAAGEDSAAVGDEAKTGEMPAEIELRGRVVCLPEEMHRRYGTDLPTNHEHIYGLKTSDETYYTLLRTSQSEALFVDERLREKELLLKGHVLPQSRIFDVTHMKSFRNGAAHELYYYCDICHINTVSPEICLCCQGPVELVEKPLE